MDITWRLHRIGDTDHRMSCGHPLFGALLKQRSLSWKQAGSGKPGSKTIATSTC